MVGSGTKFLPYRLPGSDPLQTSLTCLQREGYRSAAGFLAHVKEVKDDLEAIIKQVGKERVKVSRVANSLQISV